MISMAMSMNQGGAPNLQPALQVHARGKAGHSRRVGVLGLGPALALGLQEGIGTSSALLSSL